MSRTAPKVDVYIDWSASSVRSISSSGVTTSAASLADLKGQISSRALVVVGRRSSFVRKIVVPNAKASDIEQIVRLQAQQLFSTAHGALAIGTKITDQINSQGRVVIVAAVPQDIIDQIYAQAQAANIQVLGVVPVSVGSSLIATQFGMPNATVVETSPEGLGVDLIEGGNLAYSRCGQLALGLDPEVARTTAAAGLEPTPLITCGELRSSTAVQQSAKTPFEAIAHHKSEDSLILVEPAAEVAKRRRAESATRARFAVMMAVAAVGICAVVADNRAAKQQDVQKQTAELANEMRQMKKLQTSAQTEYAIIASVQKELDRAFRPAQPLGDVLLTAANECPENVWLTGISIERGKPLQLRGVASNNESIGSYLEILTSDSRFRDVKLVFANQAMIESTSVVQFSLSAHVVGNLPATVTKQERKKK